MHISKVKLPFYPPCEVKYRLQNWVSTSSKEVPKSQVPANLPPPPPLLVTTIRLLPYLDLKKKRKVQEVEEGEVVPSKGANQPKNAKDKRASSIDSREDPVVAKERRQQHT